MSINISNTQSVSRRDHLFTCFPSWLQPPCPPPAVRGSARTSRVSCVRTSEGSVECGGLAVTYRSFDGCRWWKQAFQSELRVSRDSEGKKYNLFGPRAEKWIYYLSVSISDTLHGCLIANIKALLLDLGCWFLEIKDYLLLFFFYPPPQQCLDLPLVFSLFVFLKQWTIVLLSLQMIFLVFLKPQEGLFSNAFHGPSYDPHILRLCFCLPAPALVIMVTQPLLCGPWCPLGACASDRCESHWVARYRRQQVRGRERETLRLIGRHLRAHPVKMLQIAAKLFLGIKKR